MGAKVGGGGGGRFSLGQNADINVTPFVDVLLVLLIIFMLAIPLATVSVKVDLPSPSPNQKPPDKPPVVINVMPGRILIGPKEVTTANLASELAIAFDVPNPTDQRVTIRADGNTSYYEFMNVMNTLQYSGYFKVGLMTENL